MGNDVIQSTIVTALFCDYAYYTHKQLPVIIPEGKLATSPASSTPLSPTMHPDVPPHLEGKSAIM